jgi:TolB protein
MSSTPPAEPESPKPSAILQPKMQQKISLRFALGLLGVAALLFGWYFLKNWLQDPELGGYVNTTGWIAALRQTGTGQQAVIIKPDGSIVDSPDYQPGAIDRDLVWQPDGQRVFFSSDRDKLGKGYHIYRWNVSSHNSVDQRSVGTRAQEHPTYPVDGTITSPYTQLLISGGVVVEFDPKTSVSHQLIPVEGKNPTKGDEGGNTSQFGPEYDHLGSSYREAYWCKDRRYIVGIMRRNDTETLVIQCMQPSANAGSLDDGMPHGLLAGDHIDLSIDPKTGNVVYAVINYQLIDTSNVPSSMIKNGKVVKEFRNIIGFINPDDMKEGGKIVGWPTADRAFAQPQVSPDGSQILFVGGSETDAGFKPLYLFTCPFTANGAASLTQLGGGPISSPNWSPDGAHIVFDVLETDGHSDVVEVDANGANTKVLTAGKGSFSSPRFSPSTAKAGS